MTDIQHIPLNKLIAWEGNVRRTVSDEGIAELAASIAADGLINPLTVIPAKGKGQNFHVVAGSRRLRALQLLATRKELKDADGIRCTVLPADADAEQISLAENVVRENMHPADEFEAFRDLIDKGKSIEDVAAAFGVTRTVVEKRLKLARVSPKVIEAYRAEKIDLDMVMAFAITDDHEAQEDVLSNLRPHNDADDVRSALTEDDIRITDKRVKFVGLKAYEKAGGTIKRDLFGDDEKNGYVEDTALLAKLVADKLDKAAAKLQKEGWKWVEAREEFSYTERNKFKQMYAQKAPLPAELEAEVKKLEDERKWLEAAYDTACEKGEDTEWPDRIDEIDQRLADIEDGREECFTPEQLAYCGAVVSMDYYGKQEIYRGLARPEDLPKPEGKTSAAADGETEPTEQSPALSASLIESLTEHKSAAIAACLLDDRRIALAAVVYTMALEVFDNYVESCLGFRITSRDLDAVEGSKAFDKLEAARENWGHKIPGTPDALWSWCMLQDTDTLLDLLAFCTAKTVHAVERKNDRGGDRLENATQLACELNLDMAEWFTPTAENYFSKVGKPQIIEALQEVGANLPPATMKKGDMAKFAEQQLEGKGWVPEILRLPD